MAKPYKIGKFFGSQKATYEHYKSILDRVDFDRQFMIQQITTT